MDFLRLHIVKFNFIQLVILTRTWLFFLNSCTDFFLCHFTVLFCWIKNASPQKTNVISEATNIFNSWTPQFYSLQCFFFFFFKFFFVFVFCTLVCVWSNVIMQIWILFLFFVLYVLLVNNFWIKILCGGFKVNIFCIKFKNIKIVNDVFEFNLKCMDIEYSTF